MLLCPLSDFVLCFDNVYRCKFQSELLFYRSEKCWQHGQQITKGASYQRRARAKLVQPKDTTNRQTDREGKRERERENEWKRHTLCGKSFAPLALSKIARKAELSGFIYCCFVPFVVVVVVHLWAWQVCHTTKQQQDTCHNFKWRFVLCFVHWLRSSSSLSLSLSRSLGLSLTLSLSLAGNWQAIVYVCVCACLCAGNLIEFCAQNIY